jgi:hypothetical protein
MALKITLVTSFFFLTHACSFLVLLYHKCLEWCYVIELSEMKFNNMFHCLGIKKKWNGIQWYIYSITFFTMILVSTVVSDDYYEILIVYRKVIIVYIIEEMNGNGTAYYSYGIRAEFRHNRVTKSIRRSGENYVIHVYRRI